MWCAPWQIEVTTFLKKGKNKIEIEVANRWVNRLIGDAHVPDAAVRTIKFQEGYLGGKVYKGGRYTFTTKPGMNKFKSKTPLPSGLLGPITITESSY